MELLALAAFIAFVSGWVTGFTFGHTWAVIELDFTKDKEPRED